MTNKFKITINTNEGDIVIENLNEKEARDIMVNAYECIKHLDEEIVFTDKVKVNALEFKSFYIS